MSILVNGSISIWKIAFILEMNGIFSCFFEHCQHQNNCFTVWADNGGARHFKAGVNNPTGFNKGTRRKWAPFRGLYEQLSSLAAIVQGGGWRGGVFVLASLKGVWTNLLLLR